jgi:hypothetical protein
MTNETQKYHVCTGCSIYLVQMGFATKTDSPRQTSLCVKCDHNSEGTMHLIQGSRVNAWLRGIPDSLQ